MRYLVVALSAIAVTIIGPGVSAQSETGSDLLKASALRKLCTSGQDAAVQYPKCVDAYNAFQAVVDSSVTPSATEWVGVGQTAYFATLFRIGMEPGETTADKLTDAVCEHSRQSWTAFRHVFPLKKDDTLPDAFKPRDSNAKIYAACARARGWEALSDEKKSVDEQVYYCMDAMLDTASRLTQCETAYAASVNYLESLSKPTNEDWSFLARSASMAGVQAVILNLENKTEPALTPQACRYFEDGRKAYARIEPQPGEKLPARFITRDVFSRMSEPCT